MQPLSGPARRGRKWGPHAGGGGSVTRYAEPVPVPVVRLCRSLCPSAPTSRASTSPSPPASWPAATPTSSGGALSRAPAGCAQRPAPAPLAPLRRPRSRAVQPARCAAGCAAGRLPFRIARVPCLPAKRPPMCVSPHLPMVCASAGLCSWTVYPWVLETNGLGNYPGCANAAGAGESAAWAPAPASPEVPLAAGLQRPPDAQPGGVAPGLHICGACACAVCGLCPSVSGGPSLIAVCALPPAPLPSFTCSLHRLHLPL